MYTTKITLGNGAYGYLSLIVWFSKREPTVESSVFGAEFFAMKNGIET
jgi:hypothetical protein